MRWFGKQELKDIWDEPVPAALGDIEAAERIRAICRAAMPSAEFVGGFSQNDQRRSALSRREVESARYQRAAKAAMESAMKVADELMRDAAVREIVELCLKAHDLKTARILSRAVQSPSIRDAVLREHPELAT